MSGGSSKIYISVESESEQQDILKNAKKTLKVLQKSAGKENLIGRGVAVHNVKDRLLESQKIKFSTKGTQTEKASQQITEQDLTTDESPSEEYWERLAEKRREALEVTLKENELLHLKVDHLEDELNTSRKMLEETRNLVEVLKEMLEETEAEQSENVDNADEAIPEEHDNFYEL